jgi:hypothetical protein
MEHTNRYFKAEHWPLIPGETIRVLHPESLTVTPPIHHLMPSPHFTPSVVLPKDLVSDPSSPITGDSVAPQIDESAKHTTTHDQKPVGEEHEID